MQAYKFIKTKGEGAKHIGFFVPRMYKLSFDLRMLKTLRGFSYVRDRLNGWHIWWVENEEECIQAIKALDELKKTHLFTYKVSR